MIFSSLSWNPHSSITISEKWNISMTWYGVLFSLGMFLAYFFGVRLAVKALLKLDKNCNEKEVKASFENFALLSIFFILIGARLGYVFCYGLPYYVKHPEEIIKVWRGGLASHGGVLGMLFWIPIFTHIYRKKIPYISTLFVLDITCVSSGIAAFMIRVGNFINQEITGIPSNLPWAITFENPVDALPGIPRHPVQLYEGVGYLILFIILQKISNKNLLLLGRGFLSGITFLGIFCIRFISEFFKSHQGIVLSKDSLLSMGQLLSIPFLFLGIVLVFRYLVSQRYLSK
ncbi:prolipoprotein diacylglyceryl transferase [Chlamydiifrater phoenicopteri]|uniref:prolipoprotein diacylglyceryl transferase n=1 Tax=Chlamydiifrater phoenicopteri TaxID=2681469 RepID=UPI001BCEA2E3|nr:prolipoprotein diacylglyceryl transferase [Chlamydiifrater phoenicopteri]